MVSEYSCSVAAPTSALQHNEMAQAKQKVQVRAFYGLQFELFGMDTRASTGQGLRPTLFLIEGDTVKGHDRASSSASSDVFTPLQLHQRLVQRAATDTQFLSKLFFTGQDITVFHEPAFDLADELIDYLLFFVKSSLFYHAESNSSGMTVQQPRSSMKFSRAWAMTEGAVRGL